MQTMFRGAKFFNEPLATWDTSSVEEMGSMLEQADAFAQDITGWSDASSANGGNMFYGVPVWRAKFMLIDESGSTNNGPPSKWKLRPVPPPPSLPPPPPSPPAPPSPPPFFGAGFACPFKCTGYFQTVTGAKVYDPPCPCGVQMCSVVGRCMLTVSEPVLKAPSVTFSNSYHYRALETILYSIAFNS